MPKHKKMTNRASKRSSAQKQVRFLRLQGGALNLNAIPKTHFGNSPEGIKFVRPLSLQLVPPNHPL